LRDFEEDKCSVAKTYTNGISGDDELDCEDKGWTLELLFESHGCSSIYLQHMIVLLKQHYLINLRKVMNLFNVVVVWPLILQRHLHVFHIQSIRVTGAESATCAQLGIEGDLVIDKVSGHVLELDGRPVLFVDPVEQVDEVADELEAFVKVGALEDFKHDTNELIKVSFLIGQDIKVLRDLQ
jgi:hypothetical protein